MGLKLFSSYVKTEQLAVQTAQANEDVNVRGRLTLKTQSETESRHTRSRYVCVYVCVCRWI